MTINARVDVSPELLLRLFGLPDNIEVVAAGYNAGTKTVVLFMHDPTREEPVRYIPRLECRYNLHPEEGMILIRRDPEVIPSRPDSEDKTRIVAML